MTVDHRHPAWLAFAVLAAAQIAIPLTSDRATEEWLSTVVVVAFATTSAVLVARHWGTGPALGAVGFVTVATLAVERVGTETGIPFGDYHYTGALQPAIGGVPVIVPLAWFAMGAIALEVGHHVGGSLRSRPSTRPVVAVVVGSLALTAWDLFLDPQMVEAGYWVWQDPGGYQGIPLSNYAGWFVTGVVVLAVVDRIRPTRPASPGAIALYAWWAVMNTIGFAIFFDRPFVALVGGAGMGSVLVVVAAGQARRSEQAGG